MLVLTSLALSLVASALAAAFPQRQNAGRPGQSFAAGCSLSSATLTLPEGSSLTAPTGAPKFVGLGVGTQNYTCADTGAYAFVLLRVPDD